MISLQLKAALALLVFVVSALASDTANGRAVAATPKQQAASGIKDFGIRYPVALDTDASVARRYQVTATPTLIFVDANGTIRYRDNRLPKNYDRRLEVLLTQDRQRSAP